MSIDAINVYQKNWAFTSAESKSPKIQTSSFGPCYEISFTTPGFAALAHIDDTTQTESMQKIFDRLAKHSINPKDVKVIVLGGWEEHPESKKWGDKVVKHIKDAGFENLSTKGMFAKKMFKGAFECADQSARPSEIAKELSPYYHFGALVDARSNKTFLLKEFNENLEKAQAHQTRKFSLVLDHFPNIELPLTEISQ
jgi:hypothetical protein